MSTKPISPAEAQIAQKVAIPEVVFDVVNELLTQRANDKVIIIKQDEVIDGIVESGIERQRIFEERMLDFEDAYRHTGWIVKYDKPGWNETYGARWEFWAS